MNSKPSPWLAVTVGILIVCCCLFTVGAVGIIAWEGKGLYPASLAVVDRAPTAMPFSPSSPAPANSPSQTEGGKSAQATLTPIVTVSGQGLYDIVVPTPSAPALIYPIQFDSNLKIVTYPVIGTTLVALSRSLDANALPDPHEKDSRYYARTDWNLSGHWTWNPTTRGCEVDSGSISISMTMTLPLLASTQGVRTDVLNRWDNFVNNTVTHETGHVKLDLQGARDFQHNLGNFPTAPGCDVIQSKLKTLFDNSFAAIDRANTDYDAQTRHGRTQGAVFP